MLSNNVVGILELPFLAI